MAHISEAAPLQISRFYTGWYSYRNPLIVPIRTVGRRIIELYDAISDGLNFEPSNKLTLDRRPGYTSVNSNPVKGRPINFFTFKPGNFPGQVYNLVDTTLDIEYIISNSSLPPVPLTLTLQTLQQTIMKPTPGLTTFAQVGAYLYIANESFMNKWDSPAGQQGVTKWGIDIGDAANSSTGFLTPASIQNVEIPNQAAVNWTIGPPSTVSLNRPATARVEGPSPPSSWQGMWSHMQNTAALDGNFANVTINAHSNSPIYQAGGFHFTIPANSLILGIQMRVVAEELFNQGTDPTYFLLVAQLTKAGKAVGQNKAPTAAQTGAIDFTFGSATDLWGTTWTPDDVNNADFGLQLEFQNPTDFEIMLGIDFVSLEVWYSTPSDSAPMVSHLLMFRTYPFNLNVADTALVIGGIQVKINGMETQGSGIGLNVGLTRNGKVVGPTRFVSLPANEGVVNLGGPSDLWGSTWTPAVIDQVDTGVSIQAVNNSGGDATFSVASVEMSVSISPAITPILGLAPEGPPGTPQQLVAETGYSYVYCYGNSVSGHISSPSAVIGPVGPFGALDANGLPAIDPNTGLPMASTVTLDIPLSLDPQVNEIHLFRTTDGGGAPFFELPNSPKSNLDDGNTPPTPSRRFTDNAPDNLLQIANVAPSPHFNDPPPFGATDPVWFGGRLWLHHGNQLFFASGPDVTMGNGEEAWFPVFVFTIPAGQIIRKFSTPNGMLVITTDAIFIVRGFSTSSFTVNDFMLDTGIRAWTAADTDGTNIYIYTTDRQLLQISPNGLISISENISDRIMAVDPALAYVAQYRFTAVENWLMVSDGSTFIYPFNMGLQAWATLEAPIGGVGAIKSMEVMPGIWQFWRGKPVENSTISYRHLGTFRDEGTAYPCNVTFGPIPVADFLTLAQMRDVVLATAATETIKMVSILPNEILPKAAKQFELLQISSSEPPELSATPPLSYHANRYTWKATTYSEYANFVFLRIDLSADANPDQIWAWTLGGTQTTGGSSLGQAGQLPQIQGR